MIELPESIVLAQQVKEHLAGKRVADLQVGQTHHGFAWYNGNTLDYKKRLLQRTITGAKSDMGYNYGYNVQIDLDGAKLVIATPIRYIQQGKTIPKKHQLRVDFDDGSALTCNVQMWGAMLAFGADHVEPDHDFPPSPLEDTFDEDYFMRLAKSCDPDLTAKAFLATDQRIPGFGNGCLHDVLYNAMIHPKKKIGTLTDAQWQALYHSLKDTLAQMVACGGRNTERDIFWQQGGYQTKLSRFTNNTLCPRDLDRIQKQNYLGGVIYFCPTCQKLP